ncbi:MAG: polysaccharide biosynthesis tyrosine autokinase [Anaerolineales bacterium]|nr:polysaccharide biosynthesis tyrosine autokinase [Anaerolineales bacterium]
MEIKRYFQLFWRWLWLIILGVIIAGGAAYLININTTPVYKASSRLLIDQAPGSGNGNDYSQLLVEQRLAQTYTEILTTYSVLEATAERLKLPYDVDVFAGKISVSAPPETQILTITALDKNPEMAALIANTLGEVFIDQNQNRENLRYADPILNWEGRISELGAEIEKLEIEINQAGKPQTPEGQAALSQLETRLNEAQIRYTEAFNNLNQLQLEQAKENSNVIVIEPARPSKSPIQPRTRTNTLLAAIVGGLIAIGVIFLIEYLDDGVKTQEQISDDTGLTTLGAIAQIKADKPSDLLITYQQPRDPISEAYRALRTNLNFSAVDGELKSILVTSSSPGEGKSTTAANLAVTMSQTGKKVIVVDADLRRPTQHTIFDLSNTQGLTTAILDSHSVAVEHLQKTKIKGLRLLTSGPIPPNPAELLNSQRMAQVIEELKQDADIILFDSPPVLTVTDAYILAPKVDGCLLVAHAGKTHRDAFAEAANRLRKTNALIFGAVLNRLNPKHSKSYYYQNYYENATAKNKKPRSNRLPDWVPGFNKR